MTYQQREEYIAPVCAVLSFQIAESVTSQNGLSTTDMTEGVDEDAEKDDQVSASRFF